MILPIRGGLASVRLSGGNNPNSFFLLTITMADDKLVRTIASGSLDI
jgi:hypothetical protein